MFKPNKSHTQTEAFGYGPHLSDRKRQQLEESEEYQFYQLIFRRIPEDVFAVLYSEEGSRPNAPINTLVAASNIRDYSRMQLLIEVLQRFLRVLTEADQDTSTGQYLYCLDAEALPDELAQLGPIYQQVLQRFEDSYGETEMYQILQRVYTEHFTAVQDRVATRSPVPNRK